MDNTFEIQITEAASSAVAMELEPAMAAFAEDEAMRQWFTSMAAASYLDLKKDFVGKVADPLELAHRAAMNHQANEEAVTGYLKSLAPDFASACEPGCSFCCHSHLVALPAEALRMARAVEELPGEHRQRIRARCRDVARQWDSSRSAELVKNHFAPCPMLDDGRCLVYESRPVACRAWSSPDRAACEKSFDSKNTVPVPQYAVLIHLKGIVFASHAGFAVDMGLSASPVSLFTAMDAIFTDREGFVESWREGLGLPGSISG